MAALQITGKLPVSGATGSVLTITGPVNTSGLGANPFIRITGLFLTVSATSTVTLKSGGNTIGSAFLGTGNSLNMVNTAEGLLDCEPGASFVIGNSAGTIAGFLTYVVKGGG